MLNCYKMLLFVLEVQAKTPTFAAQDPKNQDSMEANRNEEKLAVDIDRAKFALELKTWRLRQGLTQSEVGKRWSMTRFAIIKAEKAQPMSWEAAYRIFAKLACELAKENNRADAAQQ